MTAHYKSVVPVTSLLLEKNTRNCRLGQEKDLDVDMSKVAVCLLQGQMIHHQVCKLLKPDSAHQIGAAVVVEVEEVAGYLTAQVTDFVGT